LRRYAALDLAARVTAATGWAPWIWLTGSLGEDNTDSSAGLDHAAPAMHPRGLPSALFLGANLAIAQHVLQRGGMMKLISDEEQISEIP
jgi:hypothetical protein